MAGRPSDFKPAYCVELISCLAEGHSITAFAGMIGKNRDTVFEWLKSKPEFKEAYGIAKGKAVLFWEKQLIDFSKSGKGNAAAIIFGLKNRAADDWSDKVVNEHSGPNGGAMVVADLTTADRVKALVAFMKKTKVDPST